MSKKNQPVAGQADNQAIAVVTITDQMPDFLRNKSGDRGREEVTAEDLVIPRLELVQSLSPCRKRNDPEYIEGAEEGMMYNNLTRQLFPDGLIVVPVFFKKEWILWKDRKAGGGFRGAFNSEAEAEAAKLTTDDGAQCGVTDTSQFYCLALTQAGDVEEIVISMAKSKAKVARKWNSLMRLAGGDSFSRVYQIGAVLETNAKGEDYYNFVVTSAGFPSEAVYRRAEELYEAVASGRKTADRSSAEPSGNEY